MKLKLILQLLLAAITIGGTAQIARPVYQMDVTLLPNQNKLLCKGTIKLPPLDSTRSTIVLMLSEVMNDFTITNNANLEVYSADTINGTVRWHIKSKSAFQVGTTPVLSFSYSGGEKSSFVFNISERACFAGGNSTEWFPQVERDPRGTGTINFTVPVGYVVTAPGRQVATTDQNRKGVYQFKINHPSYFSFAAAKYFVYENVFQKNGQIQRAYLLKKRASVSRHLDSCNMINKVLEKEFGPNPYGRNFTLVEIPTDLANKTQFDGASGEGSMWASSAFLDKPFNVAYYGHELSHHWWGNALGRNWWDSRQGRLMMDEALAQYGSHKVVEVLEGKEEAKRYRLYGYPGYIDFHNASGYFMLNAAGFDQPLNNLQSTDKARILADSKGFIMYKMLADYVGSKQFSKALTSIQKSHAFASITWEQFLKLVEHNSQKKLPAFYQDWLIKTGAPRYSLSWKQTGTKVHGTIKQDTSHYLVLLPLKGVASDGTVYNWVVETKQPNTNFRFTASKRINKLLLDPEFQTLYWTDEFWFMKNAFQAFFQAFDIAQKGQFKEAKTILKKALAEEPADEKYGSRFLLNMALGQVNVFEGSMAEAKTYLQQAVALKTNATNLLPWAFYYLARASKATNDAQLLDYAIQKAIEAETQVGKYIGAAQLAQELK
jgi:hypothetical protein